MLAGATISICFGMAATVCCAFGIARLAGLLHKPAALFVICLVVITSTSCLSAATFGIRPVTRSLQAMSDHLDGVARGDFSSRMSPPSTGPPPPSSCW